MVAEKVKLLFETKNGRHEEVNLLTVYSIYTKKRLNCPTVFKSPIAIARKTRKAMLQMQREIW